MATYNKPTLRVMIYTKMDGAAIAEGIMAQAALDAYKAKKTVKGLDGDQHEVLIPYHAITQFQYGYITEEAEKADAYCGGGY